MKDRVISSVKEHVYDGKKYTIMVYGELKDVKEINGFCVIPVTFNGKNKKVRDFDADKRMLVPGFNEYYSKTKHFNMGWAICVEPDKFDYDKGKTICKRRFSRSPISTQNGRFLTMDMCQAIVDNEVEFIIEHLTDYIPPKDLGTNCCCKNEPVTDCCKNEKCESEITIPRTGDYVVFNRNGKKHIGIYKGEIRNLNDGSIYSHSFFFYGPESSNGLIEHNNITFFGEIVGNVKFYKATCCDVKLVNAYLKGAHGREWDTERKSFKLILE